MLKGLRVNTSDVLTKLQSMMIVSFELRDEPQFPLHVEGVMQPEGSTQLTHTQMPLQRLGVLWKSKPFLSLLPQWDRFAQTVNELKKKKKQLAREECVSQPNPSPSRASISTMLLELTCTCCSGASRWRYIFRSVMQQGLSPNFPKNCTISSKGSPV